MKNQEYDLPFSAKTVRQYLKDRIYSAENFESLINKFNADFSILLSYGYDDKTTSLGTFSLNSIKLDSDDHSKDSWIFTKKDDETSQLIIPMSRIKDFVEIGFLNGSQKYTSAKELDKLSHDELLEKNLMEANLPNSKTISLEEADIHYTINGVEQDRNFSICPFIRPSVVEKVLKKEKQSISDTTDSQDKNSQDNPIM